MGDGLTKQGLAVAMDAIGRRNDVLDKAALLLKAAKEADKAEDDMGELSQNLQLAIDQAAEYLDGAFEVTAAIEQVTQGDAKQSEIENACDELIRRWKLELANHTGNIVKHLEWWRAADQKMRKAKHALVMAGVDHKAALDVAVKGANAEEAMRKIAMGDVKHGFTDWRQNFDKPHMTALDDAFEGGVKWVVDQIKREGGL